MNSYFSKNVFTFFYVITTNNVFIGISCDRQPDPSNQAGDEVVEKFKEGLGYKTISKPFKNSSTVDPARYSHLSKLTGQARKALMGEAAKKPFATAAAELRLEIY